MSVISTNHIPVLVTGAGGFIGSHMVYRLLQIGHTVHVLIKSTSNLWRLKDVQKKLIIHTESLYKKRKLESLLHAIRPTAIYHYAVHGAYANQADADEMVRVNIQGLLALLNASLRVPYSLFINIGSSAEYGIKKSMMRETDVREPVSLYAATKASGTLLCQAYAKTFNKPIVTLRPFTVYGPCEELFRFIPTVIRSIRNNNPVQLTGRNVRHDYIYVDDFIDACVKVLTSKKAVSGKIFNIGSGIEYTNDEIVRALFCIAKKTVPIKRGGFKIRQWDGIHWVADMRETNRMFGWKPHLTLMQGLQKTYTWFGSHQHMYEKHS